MVFCLSIDETQNGLIFEVQEYFRVNLPNQDDWIYRKDDVYLIARNCFSWLVSLMLGSTLCTCYGSIDPLRSGIESLDFCLEAVFDDIADCIYPCFLCLCDFGIFSHINGITCYSFLTPNQTFIICFGEMLVQYLCAGTLGRVLKSPRAF